MLAQKLIFSYSSRIVVQFIQVIASIIVARVAGPGVLGTVAFGLAYASMFTSIADLGFGTAHMKNVSEGQNLERCLGTFARIKLILILAYIIVVISFFCIQKYLFNVNFESGSHVIVIFIFLVALSLDQFFTIPRVTFASYTQVVKSNLPDVLKTLINQIFRIIIVLLGFKAITLALGNLFATILIIPVFVYFFKGYQIGEFDKQLARQYIKIALPVMFIAITTKFSSTIDKVFLQFFTDSKQVGYYSAAFRIGSFVLMIGQSVNNLFFPTFSKAFRDNNIISIKNNLEKFEKFSFLFIMPVVILLTLNADIIVKVLLGREYLPSISIMRVINITMFLMVLNIPFGTVITGKGKFKTSALINLFTLIVFVISLIFLVHPKFFNLGGLGTAFSMLISYLALGIIYRIYAKRYIPILNNINVIKYTVYGIVNFSIFFYLLQFKFISNIVVLRLVFSLGFIFLTYFSFFVLGFMEREDWSYLLKIIDFGSLKQYVKKEMTNK